MKRRLLPLAMLPAFAILLSAQSCLPQNTPWDSWYAGAAAAYNSEHPVGETQAPAIEEKPVAEPVVEAKTEARVEPKVETKAESKAEPKVESKAETKVESKRKVTVKSGTVKTNNTLPAIRFKAGVNAIPDNQTEALGKVAAYMKNHPRTHIVIKGQSTCTATVKNALMRRFGINASRLSTATDGQADIVTFGER